MIFLSSSRRRWFSFGRMSLILGPCDVFAGEALHQIHPIAPDKFRHGRQDDIRLRLEKTGLDIIIDMLNITIDDLDKSTPVHFCTPFSV